MKIFNKSEGWGSKVNFVDENNILLGYDLAQHCCEYADWFISDKPETGIRQDLTGSGFDEEMPDWIFDTKYFKETSGSEFHSGGMAIFRIVNKVTNEEKFIHIFNSHNGYYSHGFEFKSENEIFQEASL